MTDEAQFWIIKQEPTAYAWETFCADGRTAWTGVRNFQARNNLRAMRVGDKALYYHSVVGKELVGVAEVVRTVVPIGAKEFQEIVRVAGGVVAV